MREVVLRCHGPLNEFLPRERRQVAFTIRFNGRRSVKDAIESAGVPHPEVDVICDTWDQRYWRGSHWARLQELVAGARSGDRVA